MVRFPGLAPYMLCLPLLLAAPIAARAQPATAEPLACPAAPADAFVIGGTRFERGDAVAVKSGFSDQGMPIVQLTFSEAGRTRFAALQDRFMHLALPICHGDQLILAPVLVEKIGGTQVQLGGIGSAAAADALAAQLRASLIALQIPAGAVDTGLVGHYYLAGLRETGSELLLKPDGRFEWMLSYGAVDQFAEGRWTRVGDSVTLLSDMPDKSAPLFTADSQQEWNATAEQHMRNAAYRARQLQVEQQCPLLQVTSVAASPAMLTMDDKPDPQAQARAERARDHAELARAELEQASAAAFATTLDREAKMAGAMAAMQRWDEARAEMRQLYDAAREPAPDLAEPVLPAPCQLPPEPPQAMEDQPGTWQRGLAVVVGNPAQGLRLSGVQVTFHYDDGHSEQTTTDTGGWALAPQRASAAVTSLKLELASLDRPATILPIKPLEQGIQPVMIDTRMIAGVPFERMDLRIEGADLVAGTLNGARYQQH